MSEKFFDCDKCGLCCKNIRKSFLDVNLDRGDGVCKNFDDLTKLCKIYYERPIFCNVDAYYEKFLKNFMSRENFHEINRAACQKLKAEEVLKND